MLFGLFREREFWSVKTLRERTQQPEAYLKEVLSEIATMHRSGEHNGTWELKANFKGDGVCACALFLRESCELTPACVRLRERMYPSPTSVATSRWRMTRMTRMRMKMTTTTIWRRFHETTSLISLIRIHGLY